MSPGGTVIKKCAFCGLQKDNEMEYGSFYTLEDVTVHYYCMLLSNKIAQRGADSEGILGFLICDIKAELQRSVKISCSYCNRGNATLMCCKSKCSKRYHLPCGLKNGVLCQFYDRFSNYCSKHRPVQNIPERFYMNESDVLCSICYGSVNLFKSSNFQDVLWAPCCKKTWYHRTCIQKLAQSAGYLFKCAICSDVKKFKKWMLRFGIFIPDKDASWELVPNAYEELLFRYNQCDADTCKCPDGREKNVEDTMWQIILCDTCGSQGIHIACGGLKFIDPEWECKSCRKIMGSSENFTNQTTASNKQIEKEDVSREVPCSSKVALQPITLEDNSKNKKRKAPNELDNLVIDKRRKEDSESCCSDIDIEAIDSDSDHDQNCRADTKESLSESGTCTGTETELDDSPDSSIEIIVDLGDREGSGKGGGDGGGSVRDRTADDTTDKCDVCTEICIESSDSDCEVVEVKDDEVQFIKQIRRKEKRRWSQRKKTRRKNNFDVVNIIPPDQKEILLDRVKKKRSTPLALNWEMKVIAPLKMKLKHVGYKDIGSE